MLHFDDKTRALLDAAARLGTVSAAARALGLDPSNAHRHLRLAEARAGARLVERRRGSSTLRLTRAARSRLGHASGLAGRALAFDAREGTTAVVVGRRTLHVAGRLPAGPVLLSFRPEDVTLTRGRPASSARNALAGRVASLREARGVEGAWRVEVACGSVRVAALVTRGALRALRLREGSRVVALVKATAILARAAA